MVRPWALLESDFSEVNDVEFTESGELITADRGGSLNVWNTKPNDPEDMSPSVAATTFPHAIKSVAASENARVIAVGVVDRAETGSVHVWDRSSQQQVESSVHLSGCPAVDFGPTGELLVTAVNESSLFVLNTENGDVLETIPLDADGASNVKVSPDGRLVAVAIHGQRGAQIWSAIDIWELETRTLLHRLALGSALGSSLEFSPRGNRLAVGDEQGTVFLVDLQDDVTESEIVLKRKLHSAQLTGIAFSPDGSCLATCGADSYVHLWDVDKLVGARGNSIFAGSHKPWISSVCYTNEPATVAVAERSGNIRLVDCETGKAGEPLDVDTHGFTHFMVAGARERGLIAIQCSHWPAQNVPGKLVLWDIQQGLEHSSHSLSENVDCSAPAFSYDGKYCATCAGGNVFVIDVAKRKIAKTFRLAAGARVAVFSPKGRWLGLGCTDGVTRLCELSDLDVRHEIQTDGHLAYRVAFSPDEQTIACVGRERRVKLFDVESERLVGEFERTPGFMTLITFSPDGQRILTGGLDGKLRSWMTESGEQLLSLDIRPNCWPNGMFSRDGSAILATSGFEAKLYRNYSSANLLELSVSELQSDACKNMTSPSAAKSGP